MKIDKKTILTIFKNNLRGTFEKRERPQWVKK